MRKISAFILCTGICLSLMPGQLLAQNKEKISVNCSNISIKDCIKQIPEKITLDSSIIQKTVTVKFKDKELSDGLRTILDAAGISNYVLQFDKDKQAIAITTAIGSEKIIDAAAIPDKPAAAKSDHGQAPNPQAALPTEGVEELAKKANSGSQMDLDTKITLPSGEVATVRQLQSNQERGSLITLSPTQEIQIPGIANPMTVQELNDRQSSANRSYEKMKSMSSNGTSSGATPPSFPVVEKNSKGNAAN